jgi:hypothetical protein
MTLNQRLLFSRISSSHSDVYEEFYLSGYNTVLLATRFHANFLLDYSSTPEDGGDNFFRNVC